MAVVQEVPFGVNEPPTPPVSPEERKPRWFPTAFTVLATVLLVGATLG